MGLVDILLVVLGAIGLSHIMADSSIAASFKYWLVYRTDKDGNIRKRFIGKDGKSSGTGKVVDKVIEMMNCHQCNGFWSGLFAFGLYYIGWDLLLWGFSISLLSPLWAVVYVILLNYTTYEPEINPPQQQLNEDKDEDEVA